MKLKGKNAIITGGSQGIGKGIALALAQEGANLVIQYRSADDKAKSVVEQVKRLGANVSLINLSSKPILPTTSQFSN